MKVSRELRERARATSYHQRKALRRVGVGQVNGIGPVTLASLKEAGWIAETDDAPSSVTLTPSGQEIHDALDALGWFPP